MQISETPIWQALEAHQQEMQQHHLKDIFDADPKRFEHFSVHFDDFLFDFSKQRLSKETMGLLFELADTCQLKSYIHALFSGDMVNKTEKRPALHIALRAPAPEKDIQAVLDKMENFVGLVRSGKYLGATGQPITDIVSLGIGGSDLGPVMACHALDGYRDANHRIHFLSNVDGFSLQKVLKDLDPNKTLCIINSKSFTTPETLKNAEAIKDWFLGSFGDEKTILEKHFLGVTVNTEKAKAFGLTEQHIFEFWEWVGGRYSIWSAVGLPIALQIGMENFKAFLEGAHEMDEHFKNTPFEENIPVLMGLIGVWNHNFWHYSTHAVMPYVDRLKELPAYLQQLEMEI